MNEHITTHLEYSLIFSSWFFHWNLPNREKLHFWYFLYYFSLTQFPWLPYYKNITENINKLQDLDMLNIAMKKQSYEMKRNINKYNDRRFVANGWCKAKLFNIFILGLSFSYMNLSFHYIFRNFKFQYFLPNKYNFYTIFLVHKYHGFTLEPFLYYLQ